MILGQSGDAATSPTLDALFRRAAAVHGESLALADPPNRAAVAGGAPRRLSYFEADKAIASLAAQLRGLGLSGDDLVALQMPNTVENVLVLLAIWRAGLIAVPLPLLWRRAEMVTALRRLGIKALIVPSAQSALAMAVAAEVFPIKHVLGFGDDLPDGMIALNETGADGGVEASYERGEHVALVTWDLAAAGLVPVARSHTQAIAGGIATVRAGAVGARSAILTTLLGGSFAGLATGLIPWLITGGRLHLHHPFDAGALAAQLADDGCDTLAVPGVLLPLLAKAGLPPRIEAVLALWRAPERFAHAPPWLSQATLVADIRVFGEAGFIAARRDAEGKPSLALPPGMETKQTGAGTIALRGALVARDPFPPGSESLPLPYLQAAADGFVDTGYTCRRDPASDELAVTGPPPGLIHVGGYRFAAIGLQDMVGRIDPQASIAPLPDALTGYRLAGNTPDVGALQQTLEETGANPLIGGAFRGRS